MATSGECSRPFSLAKTRWELCSSKNGHQRIIFAPTLLVDRTSDRTSWPSSTPWRYRSKNELCQLTKQFLNNSLLHSACSPLPPKLNWKNSSTVLLGNILPSRPAAGQKT